MAQREELMTLLREKDQLFFEFGNYAITLFLAHGIVPLLDDSEVFGKTMDVLFVSFLEMLLPQRLSWIAGNAVSSHLLLLISLCIICSAAIYLISNAVTIANAHRTGENSRSHAANAALAKEMVSQNEINYHLTIIRKDVEKNKYLLEFIHSTPMTILILISKGTKMISVINIVQQRRFNFNSALYNSPFAISIYRGYQYIQRGNSIVEKSRQDNIQLNFLKMLLKEFPIDCTIFTPVYQFTSFFSLTFQERAIITLDQHKLHISAAQLLSEVEFVLTEVAHITIRERNSSCLIINPQVIINPDQLLSDTRNLLLARLRQINLHKEYLRDNLRLLTELSSIFSYRNWFLLEYDDENLIPITEFRFDGDKLSNEARDALLMSLKKVYPPDCVSCDEEDIVIKGCIPILLVQKNAAKVLVSELKIIAEKISQVDRPEHISVAEQAAAAEIQPCVVVCEKPKKEKKQRAYFPFFRRQVAEVDNQRIPAELRFPVGDREYVYHRGDENNNPPGPVVLYNLNNMKPGRKFYTTDPKIVEEFPNEALHEEYQNVAQKANVVDSFKHQGHVPSAVYYRDVHGQRQISDYQVNIPGKPGVINVSLAAAVRTEDKVLRKLYVGNHYDPHPNLPKPR